MKYIIYKYTITPNCIISMPEGSRILCVKEQEDNIRLWALADPTFTVFIERRFLTVPTGSVFEVDNLTTGIEYIDTVSLENGRLIFHIFEVINKNDYD